MSVDKPTILGILTTIYIEVIATMNWPDAVKTGLQIAIGCATLIYIILKIRYRIRLTKTLLPNEQHDDAGRIVGK